MKHIIRYTLIILIFSTFINCEDKPDKSFYGIPSEDKNQILSGILLSYGAIDDSTGTVIDVKSGLEWKKCTQGQVFRATNNDCQGGKATATFTTPFDQGRYGATYLSFCNIEGNNCNELSLPMTLKADSLTGITSEAYNSCASENAIRTGGYTNWRVPTFPELQALAALGKVMLTARFPNTPDDYFWSSWSNEQDQSGKTARAVSFSADTIGKVESINKTTKLHIRCVRNTNGQ